MDLYVRQDASTEHLRAIFRHEGRAAATAGGQKGVFEGHAGQA